MAAYAWFRAYKKRIAAEHEKGKESIRIFSLPTCRYLCRNCQGLSKLGLVSVARYLVSYASSPTFRFFFLPGNLIFAQVLSLRRNPVAKLGLKCSAARRGHCQPEDSSLVDLQLIILGIRLVSSGCWPLIGDGFFVVQHELLWEKDVERGVYCLDLLNVEKVDVELTHN